MSVTKRRIDKRYINNDDWHVIKGEHCYAPPTWQYTDAQLDLMAHMAHRKMPASATDELLRGRRVENLTDKECAKLVAETENEYEQHGIEWYRALMEA